MEHSDIEHMAQGYPPAHIAKDSEEVIVWLATQLIATQEQRDDLAAENVALRNSHPQPFGPIMMQALDVYEKDRDQEAETGMLNAFFILRGSINIQTPATDAFINSVRAESLESFAHQQRVIADALPGHEDQRSHRITACRAEDFAEKLRAGDPS